MNDVSKNIEHLKRLVGASTDEELGAAFGSTKSAVANWRRRGRIPASVEVEMSKRFPGRALAWQWGQAIQQRRHEECAYAVALHILRSEPAPVFTDGKVEDNQYLAGMAFAAVVVAVRKYIETDAPPEAEGIALIRQCIDAYERHLIPGTKELVADWSGGRTFQVYQ